ncbi:hypothetical protein [Rhizobium tumorigenes]|uniref:hypothetical protein n=1 Tax=Rhizobium tumorigenes TaxID=2041385 RepID=UPI00241E19E0|nr:hypothetical protein [Rhizobium tumorigenes]WFS04195.1 hypothetical protein PR016_24240 [Rhizobium tumorigenes]
MDQDIGTKAELSATGQAFLDRLREISEEPGKRIYATVDGAKFGNLPFLLNQTDVGSRPLYRQIAGNHAVVVGGPWFVDFSRSGQVPASAPNAGPEEPDGDETDISDAALAAHAARLSDQMMAALSAGDPTGGGILPTDDVGGPEVVIARVERLLRFADGKSAVVFWVTDRDVTADAMYRHLRGINQILIPKEDQGYAVLLPAFSERAELLAAGDDLRPRLVSSPHPSVPSSKPGKTQRMRYERVVLRHADPNVMIQIFQVLSQQQFNQLIGPAKQLLFAPDVVWGGGLKRARRGESTEIGDSGPLILDAQQVSEISVYREVQSREGIAHYLRRVAPEQTENISDDELDYQVRYSEEVGKEFGIRTERGHAQWAFLMVRSKGRVANDPQVRSFLTQPGADPDVQVDRAMRQLVAAAAEQAGAS